MSEHAGWPRTARVEPADVSLPDVGACDRSFLKGSVDEFDPLTMKLTNSYKIGCKPAGLALGLPAHHDILRHSIGCQERHYSGDGDGVVGDEVLFSAGDNRYYFENANVGVIDAETNQFLGYITDARGHTLAVDRNNNNIFCTFDRSRCEGLCADP